jgi:hypothetical protein
VNLSYHLSQAAIPVSKDADALFLLTISAPQGTLERRPVNLDVTLDRSSSMNREPLAIAKSERRLTHIAVGLRSRSIATTAVGVWRRI